MRVGKDSTQWRNEHIGQESNTNEYGNAQETILGMRDGFQNGHGGNIVKPSKVMHVMLVKENDA